MRKEKNQEGEGKEMKEEGKKGKGKERRSVKMEKRKVGKMMGGMRVRRGKGKERGRQKGIEGEKQGQRLLRKEKVVEGRRKKGRRRRKLTKSRRNKRKKEKKLDMEVCML